MALNSAASRLIVAFAVSRPSIGVSPLRLGDVSTHRRLADVGAVLFNETLKDPPGGVTLLSRSGLVLCQPRSIVAFHGSSAGEDARSASAAAGSATPALGAPLFDGRRTGSRVLGCRAPRDRAPCGSPRTVPPVISPSAQIQTHRPRWWWTLTNALEVGPSQMSTNVRSGAQSGEHTLRPR